MRRFFTAVIAAAFLLLAPMGAAQAKDAEFTVTTEGITLNEGITFGTNHNIHVDYYDPDGYLRQVRGNDLQGPEDGSFVSWADLGIPEGSIITYVHVTGHGKLDGEWKFGKGITPGPAPEPETETKSEYQKRWEDEFICPDDEAAYGHVVERRNKYRIDLERTQIVTWNEDTLTWDVTWGEWEVVGEEFVETITERTRLMTDDESAQHCGLPSTGVPLIGAGIAALTLVGTGGALALRSRRR